MVHNIYNKSEVFFFQNNETGEKWMVGDRNELVKYLCKFIWRNNSNTGYNNPILDDYSLTGKDKRAIEVKIGYVSSICGPHPIYETRYVERKYSILDGYDRHIDIHIFNIYF